MRRIMIVILFVFANKGNAQVLDKHPDLAINFHHYVGNQILYLDSVEYKNELNQSYTVTNFKYYISNIELENSSGIVFKFSKYFLVQEDEPESKMIRIINIPEGNYKTLSFVIGVDSLANCSGAQSGALDPVNGMFWAWNTGYIFMKLDGKSPSSSAPGNTLEYHIGGYKNPHNCIRKIQLRLPEKFAIHAAKENLISIKTDITEVLRSPLSIDFSVLPSVTDHRNATTIANNYSDMFSIKQ